HVDGFFAADFADDDTVGTHTKGVDDKVADADGAVAFNVGRAGFHARHVRLAETKFGSVFDGDDALVFVDIAGEHVEKRGLAGAGAGRDENVEAGTDAGLHEFEHAVGEGHPFDQIFAAQQIASKTADGKQRAVNSDGRNGGVDARAIGEARKVTY